MNIQREIKSYESYLAKEGFSESGIISYRCLIRKFLLSHPLAKNYKHQQIINYLGEISKLDLLNSTRQNYLKAVKRYYDCLIDSGKRNDHPCKSINIKAPGKRNVIQGDLFSMNELESLLEKEERYDKLRLRNQVIISLLIYQGLMPGEIIRLKLRHIDLEKGTIFIPGSKILSTRILEIHPRQYPIIENYIIEERKKLLIKAKSDFLILNYAGHLESNVDNINYLIETLKGRFTDRNLHATAIRDSVISHWLNLRKIPIEQVQLLAGHRWISSTLRYKQASTTEQRELMNRWFPI